MKQIQTMILAQCPIIFSDAGFGLAYTCPRQQRTQSFITFDSYQLYILSQNLEIGLI